MATGTIKRKTNNVIERYQASSGETIPANSAKTFNYPTLAGKNFQGYCVYAIASKLVYPTMVGINENGAYITLANHESVDVTTGAIAFDFTD